MRKALKTLLATAGVTLLLSGCTFNITMPNNPEPGPAPSPPVKAGSEITFTESDRPLSVIDQETGLIVLSPTEGYLILGGSGSCPPIIDKITLEDNHMTVIIDAAAYNEMACTMDYRLYSHDIELAGNKQFEEDMTASTVVFDDEYELPVSLQ